MNEKGENEQMIERKNDLENWNERMNEKVKE